VNVKIIGDKKECMIISEKGEVLVVTNLGDGKILVQSIRTPNPTK